MNPVDLVVALRTAVTSTEERNTVPVLDPSFGKLMKLELRATRPGMGNVTPVEDEDFQRLHRSTLSGIQGL
jgi:hypothetical protein